MLRSILILAFSTLALIAPVRAQEEPPASPAPSDGVYTEEDFGKLDEKRVEAVLKAYPKMQAWLRTVDKEGQAVSQAAEKKGVLALPETMKFANDTVSTERFQKEVGMPMDEFYRDWGMVVAVYGAIQAEEVYKNGRAQFEEVVKSPDAPAQAKAEMKEQLAVMEKEFQANRLRVPAATREIVEKNRKRIELLMGTHEQGGETAPAAEPAGEEH